MNKFPNSTSQATWFWKYVMKLPVFSSFYNTQGKEIFNNICFDTKWAID